MVVTLGVCCMEAKLKTSAMQAILNRLHRWEDLVIVVFSEKCILESEPEKWPIVDFFICFFSAGFPLDKAEAYVALRQPVCVNDVTKQYQLLDRELVYRILQANGVPVPHYRVFWPKNSVKPLQITELDADAKRRILERAQQDNSESEVLRNGVVPGENLESVDEEHKRKYWNDVC